MNILTTIKKILPRKFICGLRAYHILVNLRGQVNKDNIGNTVDGEGNHIPWITFPALDYLDSIDVSKNRVFEFGSGGSSLYWSKRCEQVVSVEHYKKWFDAMQKIQPKNTSIILEENLENYPSIIQGYDKFDIITIDGAERMKCAHQAVGKLSEGGIIILDNSDWYPNTCNFLRDKGFTQLDFNGFTPQNSFTSTTSVFFLDSIKFKYNSNNKKLPIGGVDNRDKVLDDFI
ncbi:SAM-dependent methyltransferase [Vibrio mediterranei]|uniref:SAM-dependent methyltransferase n=1 Tax=Vibrio mediterranei TaxID=689 RepID=A0A3G4V8U4_9VIBR|nr:SAM-dependent methyltransferase [Vibrio mediterranei]AYV21213.1 SAM-dependent methyltransferase [Vibrio mediterranei]